VRPGDDRANPYARDPYARDPYDEPRAGQSADGEDDRAPPPRSRSWREAPPPDYDQDGPAPAPRYQERAPPYSSADGDPRDGY